MKTLKESIAAAMDSPGNTAIVPFLPYILQDFWEMGTSPEIVINLVRKHCKEYPSLNVLDLGCGKGAVSVKLAAALQCNCYGIDGIPEFIEASKEKSLEYGVDTLCRFEIGDIRKKIKELEKFDVIILGAVGQVLGNYFITLRTLSKHLAAEGIVVIDEAYIDDSSDFQHPAILRHGELLKQIAQAKMELVDAIENKPSNSAEEFKNIQKRCSELMTKYPDKKSLFESYIQSQAMEYDILENKVIAATMVCKKIVV